MMMRPTTASNLPRNLATLMLVAAAWGFPQASSAGVIDFTDNPDSGLSSGPILTSFSEIFDGVTASFTNPTNDSGSPTFVFRDNSFRMGSFSLMRTFEVVFDATVDFESYSSSGSAPPTGTAIMFDIMGNGVNSVGNSSSSTTFVTPLTFLAGETYTFTATPGLPTIGFIAFTEWQFSSSSVPEPATLALFGLGLAGLGFTRRRKV